LSLVSTNIDVFNKPVSGRNGAAYMAAAEVAGGASITVPVSVIHGNAACTCKSYVLTDFECVEIPCK